MFETATITQSEALYFQILDTAPDAMVVVNRHGNIVFANAQTETAFGHARADLLGKALERLIPERFSAAHKGHLARYFADPGLRSMGSGLELFGRRADGSEFPIEVSLSPVRTSDGVLVSAAIRDVTERKRIEAAAKLSADRLASAVESIQDAFALFDASDHLSLCNSVYRSLIGETVVGPVVGKPYQELLDAWMGDLDFASNEERRLFREERVARRGDLAGSFDVRTRDGRSLRVIDRRTAEGVIVKTIWDLTDDVRREQELGAARAAAEAASAAKSEFLASMSHELRTPMNAILGFAQLLQRDKIEPLSERHKERLQQVLKGGEHLLRLIDDILDLSRIEAGGVAISTESMSVRELLDEVRKTLGPMAARDGIEVTVDAMPEGLPRVAADRTRFLQILMNYGSNAIKYNRPNGKVTFGAFAVDGDRLRITVTDTGIGIAAEQHGRLFQPFQRAGQEMGPIEGTGIGLVITKRLAALMQGTVGFRSVAGNGSQFWIDLPIDRSAPLPDAPVMVRADEPVRIAGQRRPLILYVEDNPANVRFMRDLVNSLEDIELVTASTAEMGVELACERLPQVIIMDINLPGMSGLDALRLLRGQTATRDIPVIALTAAASERDRHRGLAAGFCQYLTKPVRVDELVESLEALLTSRLLGPST
ncbi:MAG: PAS domain S-box protein [Nannocystis sp.]|nr:PAS domain S-box protein [Nannocystis sp.]MBA3547017.1 PAS domain S-box protein [Nannocystis sp.]